ncbi:PAS domain-containing protein [Methylobacterium radiotolerans]|uniref:PAS domain-containing protein n=1 Tax=Methylobacterium radiotolerans TaxID=31998 RepID=UPI000B799FEC|nr:PAS domain-containing protein [Methylobacterium radiotolerans]OXE41862.1 diguanylate cyclase [Methylobacterium radiotolerans]
MIADAIQGPRPRPVDLSAALDASGIIGTWSWSPRAERCVLDAGAAEVLAGDPGLAGRPLPLSVAKACVHPEDRPAVVRQFKAVRGRGGRFVAEYRTLSPSGQVRRILDRGRIPTGASSRRLGHGVIIDVTDEPSAAHAAAHAAAEPADSLARAVDRALECRDALEGVADSELQLLIDMLLLHLGRRIAKASATGARRGGH